MAFLWGRYSLIKGPIYSPPLMSLSSEKEEGYLFVNTKTVVLDVYDATGYYLPLPWSSTAVLVFINLNQENTMSDWHQWFCALCDTSWYGDIDTKCPLCEGEEHGVTLPMKNYKWEKRMLQIAKLIATFSKDPSTQVGAVIFNPDRKTIITTGYNGFPRGTMDDVRLYEDREQKYPRVVHAEANAIVEAASQGVSTYGSSLATTHTPCANCAGLIIQAGIKHIFFEDTGDDMARLHGDVAVQLFKEAGVQLTGITLGDD